MKNKQIMILASLLALVLLANFVSAEQVCMDIDTLCLDYIPGGHCDLNDIVDCYMDCSQTPCIGGCYENPYGDDCCADDVGCVETPECTEGYEQCCADEDCDVKDPDGDIWECYQGQWRLQERCDTDDTCEEYGASAFCEGQKFYCMNHDTLNCYWREDDDNNGKCCETLEQCQTSLIYYCINEAEQTCTKRYGGCISGELDRQGTHIDDEWCVDYTESKKCDSCWSWLFRGVSLGGNVGEDIKCNPRADMYEELDLPEGCTDKVVWRSDTWIGKLFKVEITQEIWCPVFILIIGSAVILVISISLIFLYYTKKKKRGGRRK